MVNTLTKIKEVITKEKEKILYEPELFNIITEKEISKKVVKEQATIKTIFLCACGRLVKNNNIASYNLLVNSGAGAGKDWVVKRTLEIIPKTEWVYKSRISEKVLTYWHNPKFEPDWTWDGKTLYLEDISSNVLNSEVFKVFASSGSNATILINQMPVEIEIKGKPVLITTAANATPNNELVRRFTIINLDEGIDQTKLIMEKKAEAAETGLILEYDKTIIEAQTKLKRISVKIPYAQKLVKLFPYGHIIMRTHFDRFLDYIKASCALYQFQRNKDESGDYLATSQDYEIARIALIKTTSNREMIPLTIDEKEILKIFSEKLDKELYFSIREIEEFTTLTQKQLYRILPKLVKYGLLNKTKETRAEVKQKVVVYGYVDFVNLDIPKWEDIDNYCRNLSNVSKDRNVSKEEKVSKDRTFDTFDTFSNVFHATKTEEIVILSEKDRFIELLKGKENISIEETLKNSFNEETIEDWKKEGFVYESPKGFLRLI